MNVLDKAIPRREFAVQVEPCTLGSRNRARKNERTKLKNFGTNSCVQGA